MRRRLKKSQFALRTWHPSQRAQPDGKRTGIGRNVQMMGLHDRPKREANTTQQCYSLQPICSSAYCGFDLTRLYTLIESIAVSPNQTSLILCSSSLLLQIPDLRLLILTSKCSAYLISQQLFVKLQAAQDTWSVSCSSSFLGAQCLFPLLLQLGLTHKSPTTPSYSCCSCCCLLRL